MSEEEKNLQGLREELAKELTEEELELIVELIKLEKDNLEAMREAARENSPSSYERMLESINKKFSHAI